MEHCLAVGGVSVAVQGGVGDELERLSMEIAILVSPPWEHSYRSSFPNSRVCTSLVPRPPWERDDAGICWDDVITSGSIYSTV